MIKISKVLKKLSTFEVLTLFVLSLFYGGLLYIIHKNLSAYSQFPYYNFLVDAFLNLRTHVLPNQVYDLSLYLGKYYLYWGPAPILLILPFYLLGGIFRNDIVYTFVFSLVNVYLFYFLIFDLNTAFKLKLKAFFISTLIVTFAITSPNFFLAFGGRIWMTNQVISITYFLSFLIFFTRYLRNRSLCFLCLSAVFFNLAWLSRYTLVFYSLVFLYPIIMTLQKGKLFSKKNFVSMVSMFGIFIMFVCLFFAYNWLRFGNILDTGFRYQKGAAEFVEAVRSNRPFSFKYLLSNINYYFLEYATFSVNKPFVRYSLIGNSVFSVYPILLLVFMGIGYVLHSTNSKILFIRLLTMGAIINLSMLLITLGTGAIQFGNRYFFDVIIPFYLVIAFIIQKVPKPIIISLMTYGIAINILGVLAYYSQVF